ncbi:MAG TPA: DegT/DnrJ/EryC1/StrS family aminotransferase [Candidatus Latescibacteria bacterium]|nr:DegT/DnrJ/EryC1/StrS family aminotransferase [Candidatus Latescibacterota bacterium]
MSVLALCGGDPVRTAPFPVWPSYSTPEEEEAVLEAVRSDHLCGAIGGTRIAEFEERFAAWCGAPDAVTCNSGSSALQVALAALGVGPGDEVIVPVYTYYASGTSVLMTGAIPIFADISEGATNLDPDAFEAAITDRTKAVMVVHADGVPADMAEICAIAKRHGVFVVEDCSHAHGATYRGTRTGMLGDAGAFSIQHKKILSIGEGGVMVSKHKEVVDRARSYVNLGGGTQSGDLGPNLRMGEMQAALALVRMDRIDGENEKRRVNAHMLRRQVNDIPGLWPVPKSLPEGCEPVYYNFILAFEPSGCPVSRDRFSDAVKAEGVPLGLGFYTPLNQMPVFEQQEAWPYRLAENQAILERGLYGEGKCPVGEAFMAKGHLELKIHPPTGETEIQDAGEAIRKVVENVGDLTEDGESNGR